MTLGTDFGTAAALEAKKWPWHWRRWNGNLTGEEGEERKSRSEKSFVWAWAGRQPLENRGPSGGGGHDKNAKKRDSLSSLLCPVSGGQSGADRHKAAGLVI